MTRKIRHRYVGETLRRFSVSEDKRHQCAVQRDRLTQNACPVDDACESGIGQSAIRGREVVRPNRQFMSRAQSSRIALRPRQVGERLEKSRLIAAQREFGSDERLLGKIVIGKQADQSRRQQARRFVFSQVGQIGRQLGSRV